MCGLVALHGRQEESWISGMNRRIHHRGPDDDGVFRDPGAELSMAMRRLAILDIGGGSQPMTSADGRYTLVYNGEIFNAPELRRELEAGGERFSTDHSDTEVLLRLLVRHGTEALARLNGMFSFVFYDQQAATLLCARDRFGIKPLYYAFVEGRFVAASELKAICALPFFTPVLDRQSFHHYMTLMYVPGEASILEGVNRLPPGAALTYDLGARTFSLIRWWQPAFGKATAVPAAEWSGLLLAEFRDAVKRWTLSDVPIACSLSGGLDSSAIVGALAEGGATVSTFALGFTGEAEADWNELPQARMVAQHWGTRHHELVLDPDSLLDDLISMVWHLDEPYGGGLPSWAVFRFMAREVKVGLTGTGGDELFGNYGKWRPMEGGVFRRLLGTTDLTPMCF
jgi:asparagine synthase (glutamine-hydrolysing)